MMPPVTHFIEKEFLGHAHRGRPIAVVESVAVRMNPRTTDLNVQLTPHSNAIDLVADDRNA